jgi:carbamoyltransferase
MPLVVGLTWPFDHDNSVAAILDGKLIFAWEEERPTRNKHAVKVPPFRSLVGLFKHIAKLGLRPTDVEAFAVNWRPDLFTFIYKNTIYYRTLTEAGQYMTGGEKAAAMARWLLGPNCASLSKYMIGRAYAAVGAPIPSRLRIIPVEHHLAHAASAYYFSGAVSAAAVTVDGSGEKDSTVIWKVKGGEFEKLMALGTPGYSLGLFYESMGDRVGYDELEGPGKMMGLAPYGGPSAAYTSLQGFVKIQGDGQGDSPYSISTKTGFSLHSWAGLYYAATSALVDKVRWDPRGEMSKDAANVAWATQKLAEDAVVATARWARKNTGCDSLGLAGGVALNAKANMEVYYSDTFNDVFVFPASNDAGGSIGAAAYVYEHELGGKMEKRRLTNVYLGPEYSEEEVTSAIRDSKWTSEKIGDDVGPLVEMVAAGKVVTLFQGRSELGPRALGDRSIVADPTDDGMWKKVNKIKGREWWRPLAPSLIDAGDYFVKGKPHEFMVMMYRFKEGLGDRVPAVKHVDGTARIQTVDGADNPLWANLIKSFGEVKGERIVVNTSFNLAGEPLVESPADALRSFTKGDFDALYISGHLIRKRAS